MSNLMKPYNERMMDVLLYIQKNLDLELPSEELAEAACFSIVHFHRIFKGMTGESLKEHIRRLRLEKAAYKLCYENDTIINISLDAQYESPETFSRAFKKMFRLPPSDYRLKSRELASPRVSSGIYYSPAPLPKTLTINGSPITLKVDVREREDISVAFIRHIGSYFEVGKAWEKLCGWAALKKLLNSQTEFIGICYDDPSVTPLGKIRYDASISTSGSIMPEGEIGTQIVSGGKYAVGTHYGPYEGLQSAYREFYGKWLPTSSYQLKNNIPSFEKYINTPEDTAPKDLITEIYLGIY
ncbi:GyrI-like domain-containing protein [Maridesulfovibrio ferrireducens]|uniref:AraC family transcriptional regulator n=1 Tax=Maridesulfovibrio ferrireducens TaxID=246191 RepID=UPI001A203AA4|nr:AraC family transcriptional regulator [Maridesulfovibrio ferrireducens]MBI9112971.1 AraC family transcriptional regulator [Maridesulfovibrio ferrireducens]